MSLFVHTFFILMLTNATAELAGHLKPLGEQRLEEGHVDILSEVPNAKTFFEKYVSASKPVVFKGAANNIPAYKLWTDTYLLETFGDTKCDVEEGKKENRSLEMFEWTYKKFLNEYKASDIYMVNSIRNEMLGDLRLFPCLSCGGFDRVVSDVIMWFSSGGTKSVLHNDYVDNINCLFSGVKELYMVDYKHAEFIDFDSPDGSHSIVDVDAVDLNKYGGIAEAPWWRAKMEAGDCLFIPYRWFHQVRSYAVNQRNMAVNIWFAHLNKMNGTDCDTNKNAGEFVPLNRVPFANLESARFILKLELQNGSISTKDMAKALRNYAPNGRIERKELAAMLRGMDSNRDKKITSEELDALPDRILKVFYQFFPSTASQNEGLEEDDVEEDMNVKDEL